MEAWATTPGNLSPGAASRRLRAGVAVLGIALICAVVMVNTGVHAGWRALLFLPFFIAASGFYQGLYRT